MKSALKVFSNLYLIPQENDHNNNVKQTLNVSCACNELRKKHLLGQCQS